jgi:hypothetical protein
MIGNCSPSLLTPTKEIEGIAPLEIGLPAIEVTEVNHAATFIDVTAPLSSFHYQAKKVSLLHSKLLLNII